MSEDIIKALNDDNVRLRQEIAETRAEARKRRIDAKKMKETEKEFNDRYNAVVAERDALKARVEAAPSELEKELVELKSQLKVRDVRDKFRGVESQLGEKVTLDKLFKYHDFDPTTVEVESLDVDGLVKDWRDATPGLFKNGDVTSPAAARAAKGPALRTEVPVGRGAPDEAASKLYVRRNGPDSLSDPSWMHKNQARVAAASADGNLVFID